MGGFTHGIRLTWTAAAANGSTVTNYRIYRGTSASGTFTLIATVGAVLTYTDTSNPSRVSTVSATASSGATYMGRL